MRLFLSSYQIGSAPETLMAMIGANKKGGLIMNATDPFGDSRRPQYVSKYVAEFAQYGVSLEELDLRQYYGRGGELETQVRSYGLIWVAGGNTFALRRAMRKSGFDLLLPQLLKEDALVYGGFSAGACVICPTLRGIHLMDEPEKIPKDELIWEGLGIVDFCIVPHFRSDHAETEMAEKVVDYYKNHQIKFEALRDGEAIKIEAGKIDKVGVSLTP